MGLADQTLYGICIRLDPSLDRFENLLLPVPEVGWTRNVTLVYIQT
jgi:hypothetical protein